MNPIGLYLHIPFCDGKCSYCNFFSRRINAESKNEYVHYLKKAIVSWGEKPDRTVDTVYFGGGTPSLIGHDSLIELLDAVKRSFELSDSAEITVEVNPSSTDTLDFSALRAAGFNRLSVGLQSANDNELKLLGRRHSAADVRNTIEAAQKAGFDNISLDVMLAIPKQTKESLHRTLDFCADCHVQHISSYILKIEPGTRFYRHKDKLFLFDDEAQAAFYEEAVGYLNNLGYHQYEISNFCINGRESKHNLKYWHDEEYLGLGPSAHSFLDGRRFYYDSDFESFYSDKLIDEGIGGNEEEYIMLALRLSEGLIFEDFCRRFGKGVSEKMLHAAKRLEKEGYVRISDTALFLTVKGFLVSNTVIAYLLENT